jgi:hypothetical protein
MCKHAAQVACSCCLHDATEHGHRSCAVLSLQDALGSIACTGSNFLIRAAHLAEVGFFPTYTMVRLGPWSAKPVPAAHTWGLMKCQRTLSAKGYTRMEVWTTNVSSHVDSAGGGHGAGAGAAVPRPQWRVPAGAAGGGRGARRRAGHLPAEVPLVQGRHADVSLQPLGHRALLRRTASLCSVVWRGLCNKPLPDVSITSACLSPVLRQTGL